MLGQVSLSLVEFIYARYMNDSQIGCSRQETVTFA
ncbi:hypothetical protein VHE8714_03527 [Vibrio splendidus]|nr:hypothetical protein VHE8714_03527 [Vibrio splendidus]